MRAILPAILLAAAIAPHPATAGDDHDRARELRAHGEVMPLAEILKKLMAAHPGSVLDTELEEEHGKVVYEIKMHGDDDVVHTWIVDAKSGNLIGEEKD